MAFRSLPSARNWDSTERSSLSRVLIIGVDSTIGRATAEALVRRGDDVIGTTRRPDATGPGTRIPLDLAAPDVAAMNLPAADTAVICAAMARYADCREQPERARAVNVTAPVALARRLAERGTHIVLLSTSAVFDCRSPWVPADRPTAPTSAYGAFKAEAEAAILALGPMASVLRLTKVIVPDMPLFAGWIAALRRGARVQAFGDLTFSPISARDVVDAIVAVASDKGAGIYQISGAEDISYADAARHFCRRLGQSAALVEPVRATDNGIPESEVAYHTTLDTARLTALTGWTPPRPAAVLDTVLGPMLTPEIAP